MTDTMRNIFLIGKAYTTLSLAVLPVAIVALILLLAGFEEHGPQSQGLGALVVIAAIILAGLSINAIIAAILSFKFVNVRPTLKQFFSTVAALSCLSGLYYAAITFSL